MDEKQQPMGRSVWDQGLDACIWLMLNFIFTLLPFSPLTQSVHTSRLSILESWLIIV